MYRTIPAGLFTGISEEFTWSPQESPSTVLYMTAVLLDYTKKNPLILPDVFIN